MRVPESGLIGFHKQSTGTTQLSTQPLGKTPFEVLYGQSPRHLGISDPSSCQAPDLEDWLQERNMLNKLIHQQLLRA